MLKDRGAALKPHIDHEHGTLHLTEYHGLMRPTKEVPLPERGYMEYYNIGVPCATRQVNFKKDGQQLGYDMVSVAKGDLPLLVFYIEMTRESEEAKARLATVVEKVVNDRILSVEDILLMAIARFFYMTRKHEMNDWLDSLFDTRRMKGRKEIDLIEKRVFSAGPLARIPERYFVQERKGARTVFNAHNDFIYPSTD